MKNFLQETIDCLEVNGRTAADVRWVGTLDYKNTWEYFCERADFMYDNNSKYTYINLDLIVVGEDFWLERREYYGSELWEFKELPTEPEKTSPLILDEDSRRCEIDWQWVAQWEAQQEAQYEKN